VTSMLLLRSPTQTVRRALDAESTVILSRLFDVPCGLLQRHSRWQSSASLTSFQRVLIAAAAIMPLSTILAGMTAVCPSVQIRCGKGQF